MTLFFSFVLLIFLTHNITKRLRGLIYTTWIGIKLEINESSCRKLPCRYNYSCAQDFIYSMSQIKLKMNKLIRSCHIDISEFII